jgi:hypothetical protein
MMVRTVALQFWFPLLTLPHKEFHYFSDIISDSKPVVCALVQAFSRPSVYAEEWVGFQTSLYSICGGQPYNLTSISPITSGFPYQ